jgi:predicted DsbA family dithiol-disulfide isomerase
MALTIDVISDVVCPWCFIGKRHLESALAARRKDHPGEEQPQVRWHPFQLNPQLPRSGMPRAEYIATKFGGPQRAKEIYARVANAGARAGIAFDFDRITVQPNTLNAHRLIHRAGSSGRQDAMAEALFRAYFLEGADLSRDDTLTDIAARAGFDRDEIVPTSPVTRTRLSSRTRISMRGRSASKACLSSFSTALCRFRRATARGYPRCNGKSAGGACCGAAINTQITVDSVRRRR